MPDFFKKLKKKVDKKKMTGADKMGSNEKPSRRLKFLPFQASTTSIFCRQKQYDSEESVGEKLGFYSFKDLFHHKHVFKVY